MIAGLGEAGPIAGRRGRCYLVETAEPEEILVPFGMSTSR